MMTATFVLVMQRISKNEDETSYSNISVSYGLGVTVPSPPDTLENIFNDLDIVI